MDSAGRVSVIAGTEDFDFSLRNGVPATRALLGDVWDIALNKRGELHFADADACLIRKIDAEGLVRTVAGNGRCEASPLQGVPATDASLNGPRSIAFDNNDNLLISETLNSKIRMVDASGILTTFAGNGTTAFADEGLGATSGAVTFPHYLAVDKDNNVYFVEWAYCRVRRINVSANPQAPVINTVFENLQRGCFQGGTNPQGMSPIGLAITGNSIYVSEQGFNRVSAMVNKSAFKVIAGDASGIPGSTGDGGPAAAARLNGPLGLYVEDSGTLLVADRRNHRIRAVSPDGNIRNLVGASRFAGDNGPAANASLFRPRDMAFDRAGNLFFADELNHVIRKIDRAGVLTTVAGAPGIQGSADGSARTARLNRPRGLAVDSKGNIFFSDWGSDRIRKVDAAGEVSTLAPVSVRWRDPGAVALSQDESKLYVADTGNHTVRAIDVATSEATTVAGTGTAGFAGDQGPAAQARLSLPEGLAVDRQGNLLIADTLNRRVRRVNISTGTIDTVIGNGEADAAPSGPARQSGLVLPIGLSVDGSGNIFIASAIRTVIRYDAASGAVATIAGRDASLGYSGDGGFANNASFSSPWAVRADASGNVYVADTDNNRIRLLEVVNPAEVRISAGNNQSAPVNGTAGAQIRVQVLSRTGLSIPGVPVNFSVVSGTARLSASRVLTDRDGFAAASVTMGPTAGTVQIRASVDGVSQPVTFSLTAVPVPVVSSGGITGLGGGSLGSYAPGSLIRIRGENLAASSADGANNMVAGSLPTSLAGVCVAVGTARAPLVSVSPREIVALVPRLDLAAPADLRVINECGTPLEFASTPTLVKLASAAPEFLAPIPAGAPGDTVTLLASGLGDTDPPVEPGSVPAAPAPLVQTFSLRLGDTAIAADQIAFAGLGTSNPGVYEVRFKIPEGTAAGNIDVTITVGDAASPPAVLRVMPVQ